MDIVFSPWRRHVRMCLPFLFQWFFWPNRSFFFVSSSLYFCPLDTHTVERCFLICVCFHFSFFLIVFVMMTASGNGHSFYQRGSLPPSSSPSPRLCAFFRSIGTPIFLTKAKPKFSGNKPFFFLISHDSGRGLTIS